MTHSDPHPEHLRNSKQQLLTEGDYLDDHFLAARQCYEATLAFADIQPGWTVLDAGAGGGSFLPGLVELVGPTGNIHALDWAPENVDLIATRVAHSQFPCPVVARQGSIKALPYGNDSFDAIWCANVLQYLPVSEWPIALQEFKRVVRPGGLVIVKEADLAASTVGLDHLVYWRLLAKACQTMVQIESTLRTHELPAFLRACGLERVRYQMYLQEWHGPLQPHELRYLQPNSRFWAAAARDMGVTGSDLDEWQRLVDEDRPDYLLRDPDFYRREAYAVAVGQVGAH